MSENYFLPTPKEVYVYFEFDDVTFKNADTQVLVKQYRQKEEVVD